MQINTITPQRLNALHKEKESIKLIDVRTPLEFREVHAEMACNTPLDSLDPKALTNGDDQPVYVICRTGSRGKKACEKLIAAGHQQVFNVEGGTLAWEAAGLPVKRGKKTISLERQVRITAGFLAFLGAILAVTIHPYFAFLSAFIGAGLMFAGITDTCGMGMMLAKMPWNQVKADEANSCCTE